MVAAWKQFQEDTAAYFRSLGLDAETDVRVPGARTSHDVDVLVRSHHSGFDATWIVECKHWKTAVSKLHVLALREIVIDTGSDRGVLLAESGFQSGAIEAANLTNVRLTSLATLKETTQHDVYAMRLRELFDRTEKCSEEYWEIPKETRIAAGVRHAVGDSGYSGARVIEYCRDVLSRALRDQYPFEVDTLLTYMSSALPRHFNGPGDVVSVVEKLVAELEGKLRAANAVGPPMSAT